MAGVSTPFTSYYAIAHPLVAATKTPAAYTSSAIDTSATDADEAVVIVSATIAGGATVDCKLQSSATTGGSYADITDGDITQIVATGSQAVCVKIPAGKAFLKTVTTVGVANAEVDVTVITRKRVCT